MYLGKIIEIGPAADLYGSAAASVHQRAALGRPAGPGRADSRERIVLRGDVPSPSTRRPDAGSIRVARRPRHLRHATPRSRAGLRRPARPPRRLLAPDDRGGEPLEFTPEIRHGRRAGPGALEADLERRDSDRREDPMSIGRLTPDEGRPGAGQEPVPQMPRPPAARERRSRAAAAGALAWAPAAQGQGRAGLARRHRTGRAGRHLRAADRADRPPAEHPVPRQWSPGRERSPGRTEQPLPLRHRPARSRRARPDRLRRADVASGRAWSRRCSPSPSA